jgi:tRNA(Arg) A34 adenosine deaminase TadA
MSYPRLIVSLPEWADDFLSEPDKTYPTTEERMRLAIKLSRLNIEHGTGGPFGAAIFDMKTHRLIAPGMNLVLSSNCSVFHAEMTAIMIAQKIAGHFDLGNDAFPSCELVSSTEPCAMCFGAIPWSGIRKLACGARDEDARSVGFDEGPKLKDWQMALEDRGITVIRDVCREEAKAVLRQYAESGGVIYNARQGSDSPFGIVRQIA